MVNSQLFIIFAAVTYILPKMKKNFLVLTIALFALCVEAAPPLRVLMPMKINNGTIVAPLDVSMVPTTEGACCASQSLIGEGRYLQHSGTPRVLTILAAFQDLDFVVNDPVKAFDQYLNGDKQEDLGNKNQLNIASVRQYFEICSHKQFSPQFDVVGPITLPQKMSYYGGSSSNGSDDKFSDFCKDAMEQAKSLVNDWSVYDNDKDGRVELVCVIFAGYGQNQGGGDSTIWAKAASQNLTVNNHYRITRFNCSPELFNPSKGVDGKGNPYDYSQYINGTGVFIHEFSHCMGLPDLYATNKSGYVNNQGMETYSIMDYGLYNYNGFAPCPYNAWEQEVMGWMEMKEIQLTDNSQQAITDLLPLIEGGKAYKLVNADNNRDFMVMENVQKRGLNQRGDGHGLLVYHVDYPYTSVNMTDSPNNNPGHPSVAIVPSGGLLISSYLRGTDKQYTKTQWQESLQAVTFPGTAEVTSLTDEMQLPNYCFWNGKTAKNTGFVLSSISEDTEAGTVSFVVSPNETVGVNDVRYKMTDVGGKVYYDLQGRKVVNPTKGLYIVNGKLVHRF
jgi:immune inhibitor A